MWASSFADVCKTSRLVPLICSPNENSLCHHLSWLSRYFLMEQEDDNSERACRLAVSPFTHRTFYLKVKWQEKMAHFHSVMLVWLLYGAYSFSLRSGGVGFIPGGRLTSSILPRIREWGWCISAGNADLEILRSDTSSARETPRQAAARSFVRSFASIHLRGVLRLFVLRWVPTLLLYHSLSLSLSLSLCVHTYSHS